MEYISALIVNSQREESMKRLLEWKQRMLQSPLTRKSSRNASRTQTPTNSDSPVPSLNNDDIRKKVLEELQQPSTPTVAKERRLSRKGSSGSRSSRYTFHIKGAGSFHIHRKTMKELGTLAVLGVREQPNLAQNLVTLRH